MFVRWKRRKKAATRTGRRPRRRSESGDSLYCVLVESLRVGGEPRQKVICYLGSLDEGNREKLWLRVDFWDVVSAKLDRLQLKAAERTKLEDEIGRVVARVPEDEVVAFKKARQEWWEGLQELMRL